MSADSSRRAAPATGTLFSLLLVALAALILARSVPLAFAYGRKLLSLHSVAAIAFAVVAAAAALLLLAAAILRRRRVAALTCAAIALLLLLASGNFFAGLSAAAILATTFLAGDALFRVLSGREAADGDLSSVFAAGVVTLGLAPLALGPLGLWRSSGLVAGAVLLALVRRRRVASLGRLLRGVLRLPAGEAPPSVEALWLAATALFLAAAWVGALSPETSWDGLAYHLPEARDAALTGRVEPLFDLAPQTFFWHNEETYLSLGFLFGGERVVRLLHFAVGLGGFGAVLALARRVGAIASGPLALLALAAFPTAILQLHATYVDWAAAFLVAAAAAETAAARQEPRRLWLAGFLFGGAVATKVFALLAAPALLILLARRGGLSPRRLAPVAAGCLLALAGWLAWSQSREGFFLAPYRSFSQVVPSFSGEKSPSEHARAPLPIRHVPTIAGFLELPYDLTFHSHRFEQNGDGYDGMLPLLAVPGVAGWGLARLALFLAASLPVVVPWYRLYDPSVRYLIPLYPLYALFAAHGLTRATGRFSGRAGLAAGLMIAATALSFPVQFGSSGIEWKVAMGVLSREKALEEKLDSYPLWKLVRPEDRVVFLGEYDRFHCPARWTLRNTYRPVNQWGYDPDLWRKGLLELRVTHIMANPSPPHDGLLDSLKDTVALVERSRSAALYRVRQPGAR